MWGRAAWLVSGLTMALSTFAEERWIRIPNSDESRSYYMDRQSLVAQGATVLLWEIELFLQNPPVDKTSGKVIGEKRIHRRVDCLRQEQSFLQGVLLDRDGRLIETIIEGDSPLKPIPITPGSVAAAELGLACQLVGIKEER